MDDKKKKIYQKKINDYNIDYNLTGNIKLLEKMEKYKKKLNNNEGGGRHANRKLTPDEINSIIQIIRTIFKRNISGDDNCTIFGNYLALTIKKNIIENEEKLKTLGELVRLIILKILDEKDGQNSLGGEFSVFVKMPLDQCLSELLKLLNNDEEPTQHELTLFTTDIKAEIIDALASIDFKANETKVEEVIMPAVGIELGSLFTKRMPVRLIDPCILIGRSVLHGADVEIQKQFGVLIMEASDFLNTIVSDEAMESIPSQTICAFGNRLFRFFTETFQPRFELEIRDSMMDTACGSFGIQALDFFKGLAPQVEVLLQIDRIGTDFFQLVESKIFPSLSAFKKSTAKLLIPTLPKRKLELFNVNEDAVRVPKQLCSTLIQQIVEEGTMPVTYVFLDSSGSQKGDTHIRGEVHERNYDDDLNPVLVFVRTLCQKEDVFFHKFGGIPRDTPPGYQLCDRGNRVDVTENGWKKLSDVGLTSESLFSHGVTDTVMVKNGLESLPQNVPINLVFQCDGNFTSGSRPLDSILTECVEKLQNIKRVSLVFSPWTLPRDQEYLTRAIRLVVNSIASSIEFVSVLLPKPVSSPFRGEQLYAITMTPQQRAHFKDVYLKETLKVYDEGKRKPCVLLPPFFYSFKDFMVHKDLTPHNVVKLLDHLDPTLKTNFINQMINLLIETIATNPELLNIDGNIYQTLHAVARLLQNETFTPNEVVLRAGVVAFAEADRTFKISKAYFNWISMRTVQAPSQELTKLIAESKVSRQEIKFTEFKLSKNCIGKFFFKNCSEVTSISLERIRAIVSSQGVSADLFNLLQILIPEILFVPNQETPQVFAPRTFAHSMSIVCPDVERDPTLSSICLSSFFVPFGGGTLSAFTTAQLAMYTFSSDNVLGNPNFMRICISYCLNLLKEDRFFKQVTGYDVEKPQDFSNIDDKLFIFDNARLLYRFLLLIPTEFKEKYSHITKHFEKISKFMLLHSLFYRNLSHNKVLITLKKQNRRGDSTLRPGCVVHVDDATWNHHSAEDINQSDCPWKSLPAVVKLIEKRPDRDGHAWWFCEYYDKPLGTGDTHSIRQSNLTDVLSFSRPSVEIDKALYAYLSSEREKDGPEIRRWVGAGGVPRDVPLHEKRLQVVREICERVDGKIGVIEVRSEVSIPKETLLELICFPPRVKAILSGNLSRTIIMEAIHDAEMMEVVRTASLPREPDIDSITFMANSKRHVLDRTEIMSFLVKFHSKLIPFEEWSGSRLKINTCTMCFSLISSIGEITSTRLRCGHLICEECFDRGLIPDYKPGSFISKAQHLCATCKTMQLPDSFIVPSLHAKLAGQWWAPLLERMERENKCVTSATDASGNSTRWRFCAHKGCTYQPLFNAKLGVACIAADANEEQILPSYCPKHDENTTELRFCPACNMPGERIQGCDKMTCCPHGSNSCGEGCSHSRLNHQGRIIAQGCGTIYCFWCLQSFGLRDQGKNPFNRDRAYDHIWGGNRANSRTGPWKRCWRAAAAIELEEQARREGKPKPVAELRALQRKPHEPPDPESVKQAAELGIPPSFPIGAPLPMAAGGGAAAARPAASAQVSAKDQWQQLRVGNEGRIYYMNKVTGVGQWDPPPGFGTDV